MLYKRLHVLGAASLLWGFLAGTAAAGPFPGGFPGQPWASHVTAAAGAPGEGAWNIVWNADGVAFVGSDRLWRWDGAHWRALGEENFIALRGMAFDPAGKLWLGGVNLFGIYDPDTLAFSSRLDWLPPEHRSFGETWAVHHDGQAVWLATDRTLFQLDPGQPARVWQFASEHRVIFHFLDDGVFAHEAGRGLWRLHDQGRDLLNDDPRLAAFSVLFLERQPDHSLIAISGAGLFRLSPDGGEVQLFKEAQFYDNRMSTAVRIGECSVLVGTLGSGAYVISNEGELIRFWNTKDDHGASLVLNAQLSPLKDVWILTKEGIWRIHHSLPARFLGESSQYPSGFINDLRDEETTFFLACGKGLFAIDSNDQASPILKQLVSGETLKISSFYGALLFDRYAHLLLTDGESVREWHDFGSEIRSFAASGDGVLWISLGGRVAAYRAGLAGLGARLGEAPEADNLTLVGVDGSGRAWAWAPRAPLVELQVTGSGELAATRHTLVGGVDLLQAGWEPHVTEGGPVLVLAGALARPRADGAGWERAALPGQPGLPVASAFRQAGPLLEGWLLYLDAELGSHSLVEVRWPADGPLQARLLPWLDLRQLGRIHRMAVLAGEEPVLAMAGARGLLLAPVSLADRIPPPSAPVVWDETGLRRAVPRVQPFSRQSLQFHYSSTLGQGHYPVRYQTRLRGLDADWSEPREATVSTPGRLFEGTYVFEVRAVDPVGRASPAAAVAVRILAPWYRTAWAYAGYLAAAAALLYGFTALRERRLRLRQQELEALVAARTRELERANQFKNDFIANLSHEIRNPLNGVIGLIRQLKDGTPPPARHLNALRAAALYLRTTVEEVLDFSKLSSGLVELEATLFDPVEVVRGVAEIYRQQASDKGLELTCHVSAPERLGIVSDWRKLQQIVGNLTGNAVKFTRQGAVHVGAVLKPDGQGSGLLSLWVEDTGPGIAPADRERIFEKFYQSRTGGPKTAGTGLGLSLVKAYTECLGGRIELKSEPGAGATFYVTVPVETRPLDEAADARPEAAPAGPPVPVLLVDDHDYNRIFIEDLLAGHGCTVDSAATGDRGLEMALAGAYRAILLDWDLPGITGLEIARRLRASGRLAPGTCIVGMTAYATEDVRRQCLEAGMQHFLSKPLQAEQLLGLVAVWRAAGEAPLLAGRGLLGEMAAGPAGWEPTLARWRGYFGTYLAEVEQALAGGEPEPVRKAAHRLLGHLRMLDVRQLPDILKDLLTAAHAGDMEAVRREWAAFQHALPRFLEELSATPW